MQRSIGVMIPATLALIGALLDCLWLFLVALFGVSNTSMTLTTAAVALVLGGPGRYLGGSARCGCVRGLGLSASPLQCSISLARSSILSWRAASPSATMRASCSRSFSSSTC